MSLTSGAADLGSAIASFTTPVFGSEKVTTTTGSTTSGSSTKTSTAVIAVVVVLIIGAVIYSVTQSSAKPATT